MIQRRAIDAGRGEGEASQPRRPCAGAVWGGVLDHIMCSRSGVCVGGWVGVGGRSIARVESREEARAEE